MKRVTRTIRRRRNSREFDRVLRTASPAMRQELYAAASHQNFRML
jgi:hypothetical protein